MDLLSNALSHLFSHDCLTGLGSSCHGKAHSVFRTHVQFRVYVILASCLTVSGCVTSGVEDEIARISLSNLPRELDKVTLPEYRVEPPDILLIEAVSNTRPSDSPLRAGDELFIQVANGLPLDPKVDFQTNPLHYEIQLEFERAFKIINQVYRVGSNGAIDLGPEYGLVPVSGHSIDQAKEMIERHLMENVHLLDPKVAVSMPDVAGIQQISGEHLVRPDGTVSLGIYGSVQVTGLTIAQVKAAVEEHLFQHINEPEINVDVLSYNSKVYYVITDGGGYGEEVIRLPITGNETVLDAISQIQGLSEVSSKQIWIARPAPSGTGCAQILDVHWKAIAAEGITTTNYQILPGDRIYIKADDLMSLDIFIAKVVSPFERVIGVILLGHGLQRELQFGHIRGGNSRGFGGGF